jgi:hypothetical protein
MIPFRRAALGGLAAVAAATVAATGPAGAMSTADPGAGDALLAVASAEESPELPLRLERACLRIPNLEIRTERLANRLDGDDSTLGSLLWLEGKVQHARDAGREQLATVLENRLAVRTKTREILDQRQEELARLEQRCIDLGVDL